MRHLIMFMIAAALVVPGEAAQHTFKGHNRRVVHSSPRRAQHGWDSGYTYQNPFGLPQWLRRPRAVPRRSW